MENLEPIINEFHISEIVARTMINRGINTIPKVNAFTNTDLRSLKDPYLLKGMRLAVEKILKTVKCKDKVCVYGDYDVDGITSTAIMMRTLRKLGADAVYYIPNRIEEGYGLSISSMDRIKELGVSLIVTVDCGIRSNEVVDYAISLGMDVIITDHHECEGNLPNAMSIVNPHQSDCSYPHKGLAGVGVAFKLVSALLSSEGYGDFPEELLDIVSIGTIADVVPLLDENRIIVKNGLERIRNTNNEGVRALLEVCGLNGKELNTYNVAFMLAPRINAAGRIADATECVELLLTDNANRAMDIAKKLDSDNRERQAIENEILNSAAAIIDKTVDVDKDKVLVLHRGRRSGGAGSHGSRGIARGRRRAW
jgi:single-stranded-DNA-specific exonuclease